MLPNNICHICIDKLDNIVHFIDLAKGSDETLREILRTKEECPYSPPNVLSDTDSSQDHDIKQEDADWTDMKLSDREEIEIIITEDTDDEEPTKSPIEKKTEKNSVSCKVCDEKFKTLKDLKYHQQENESCTPKKRPVKCQTCNKKFKTLKNLREHLNQSEKCKSVAHKCSSCELIFETPKRLREHVRVHSLEPAYECKVCGAKFKFSQNLKRHDTVRHKGIKPFKCDICGKGRKY